MRGKEGDKAKAEGARGVEAKRESGSKGGGGTHARTHPRARAHTHTQHTRTVGCPHPCQGWGRGVRWEFKQVRNLGNRGVLRRIRLRLPAPTAAHSDSGGRQVERLFTSTNIGNKLGLPVGGLKGRTSAARSQNSTQVRAALSVYRPG